MLNNYKILKGGCRKLLQWENAHPQLVFLLCLTTTTIDKKPLLAAFVNGVLLRNSVIFYSRFPVILLRWCSSQLLYVGILFRAHQLMFMLILSEFTWNVLCSRLQVVSLYFVGLTFGPVMYFNLWSCHKWFLCFSCFQRRLALLCQVAYHAMIGLMVFWE